MRNFNDHIKQCAYLERSGISAEERSRYSKVYGINRCSALCDLPNFDITMQLPQDIMHLRFEGLFPMNIELILRHLIYTLKVKHSIFCPLCNL